MQDKRLELIANMNAFSNQVCKDNKEGLVMFKRYGYDPFIDFLKGLCIVFVILTHCIPEQVKSYILFDLWGVAAVPLFLILQVFHTYKKGINTVSIHFYKIWKRIIKPFLFAELLCLILIEIVDGHQGTMLSFIKGYLYWGGFGVGAYYPWVYVQFSILLSLFVFVFKRVHGNKLLLTFVFLSELFEVLCCISNIPEWLYRLSFLRYTFLVYLGYIITTEGSRINLWTLLLSVLSILFTLFFANSSIDCFPYFFTTLSSWKTCHWVCYYYNAYLLLYLLWILSSRLQKTYTFTFLIKLGKYSYEIFLFQMIYFIYYNRVLELISKLLINSYIVHVLGIIISLVICILPIIIYKEVILHCYCED